MTQRHSASLHMTCARCRVEVEFTLGLGSGSADHTRIALEGERYRSGWGKAVDLEGAKLDLCPDCSVAFRAWIEGPDPPAADHPNATESRGGPEREREDSSPAADHPKAPDREALMALADRWDRQVMYAYHECASRLREALES